MPALSSSDPPFDRLAVFESYRQDLTALAYRMLGDMAAAEDIVQEAWIRWHDHNTEPDSPRAFLVTIVTRLCLNELGSARFRREERRPDRLPEPVALEDRGITRVELLEQLSMAFLVLIQRLTPAERAVLLLHDVFDFDHREIAAFIGKSIPACRKLLERAHDSLATERRMLLAPTGEHRRLLHAFLDAVTEGDVDELVRLLADDVVLITDGGVEGRRVAGLRNLPRPLLGAKQVAAFLVAAAKRGSTLLRVEERELNGQPAIVFRAGDRPFAALLLAVSGGKIQRVFFHADESRLRYLGDAPNDY
jgi:RNA polymerase sigma-70 factor (ECF subfamily)